MSILYTVCNIQYVTYLVGEVTDRQSTLCIESLELTVVLTIHLNLNNFLKHINFDGPKLYKCALSGKTVHTDCMASPSGDTGNTELCGLPLR